MNMSNSAAKYFFIIREIIKESIINIIDRRKLLFKVLKNKNSMLQWI